MKYPKLFDRVEQIKGGFYWERLITLSIIFVLLIADFNFAMRFHGPAAQIIYSVLSLYLSVVLTIRLHPKKKIEDSDDLERYVQKLES